MLKHLEFASTQLIDNYDVKIDLPFENEKLRKKLVIL